MHRLLSLISLSCVFVCVLSSFSDEETCAEPVQSLPGGSLLQARSRGLSLNAVKFALNATVNPSGAAAPLDETGYAAVADRCCQAEMQVFIERQAVNMGYEVCQPAGLAGIVKFHSCELGVQTFEALSNNLMVDATKKCNWLAPTGTCKPLPEDCPAFPSEDLPDCGCSRSKAVLLDFEKAVLLQNNLGGKGPDGGEAVIRFGGIGEHPTGEPFDLVISAPAGYEGTSSNNGKSKISPKFAQLAIKCTGNPAGWDGNVKMQLSFVKPGTTTPVVLPAFFFALFDVDAMLGVRARQTASGKGYKGYVTDVNTDLAASKGADGSTKFTATKDDVPNPTDPMSATQAQRGSMVMYFYESMSSFEFTLGCEADAGVTTAEKWFNFAGVSALMDRCGP